MARLFALIASCALAATVLPANAGQPELETAQVRARVLSAFKIGSSERRFGPFEFVGGLELTSPLSDFGALSGIRFTDGGTKFVGVADTGFWFRGAIARDAEGRPAGVTDFAMKSIPDLRGDYSNAKWETDAESIAVGPGGDVIVGFERQHRISVYRRGDDGFGRFERDLDFVVPRGELRNNRGFETIAFMPDGTLAGVTEKSIDAAGNIFAAILDGPKKGIFKIARSDEFDITDGDFLPNGDLLILERRFSMAENIGMRLRRIAASDIAAGATVDGPVLMEADFTNQIDNMEGLDVWQNGNGETFVSLVSDDNHSLLQRTLYLEFRLLE